MNPDGLVLPDELAGVARVLHCRGIPNVILILQWGLAVFYRNFYGGFAVHHLLQPFTSPSEDPNTRFQGNTTAHLGAMIPIYEKRLGKEVLQLSPNLVFPPAGYLSTIELWTGSALTGASSEGSGFGRICCFLTEPLSSRWAMEMTNSGYGIVMMPNFSPRFSYSEPWEHMKFPW